MIRFASKNSTAVVRQMWQTCFGDSDEFLDIFFTRAYIPENTLLYFDGEDVVASLQMLPYNITFCGHETPFYYLAGLCTLPQHRQRGYMALLIHRAHELMRERRVALSILIPAEEWLFEFYNKYGYEQVFENGLKTLPSLKRILDTTSDIEEAYKVFDNQYRNKDFCVQKTFKDFETIIMDARTDDFPPKKNLSAMAYIDDIKYCLTLYAHANPQMSFTIRVEGETVYKIDERECSVIQSTEGNTVDFSVDRRQLCRLLFGFKTKELSEDYFLFFPERETMINLMLE